MRRGQGTILPGVTRRSLIELARARGYTVEEVPVPVAEAMEADEVFTSGTAVVVSAVGSITYQARPARGSHLKIETVNQEHRSWAPRRSCPRSAASRIRRAQHRVTTLM